MNYKGFDFRSILGALGWIEKMRYDIAFALRRLQPFAGCPTIEMHEASHRILKYLRGTYTFCSRYQKPPDYIPLTPLTITAFADSDFASQDWTADDLSLQVLSFSKVL